MSRTRTLGVCRTYRGHAKSYSGPPKRLPSDCPLGSWTRIWGSATILRQTPRRKRCRLQRRGRRPAGCCTTVPAEWPRSGEAVQERQGDGVRGELLQQRNEETWEQTSTVDGLRPRGGPSCIDLLCDVCTHVGGGTESFVVSFPVKRMCGGLGGSLELLGEFPVEFPVETHM